LAWPPLSCGIKANFGTMTKPLHVGHIGRNGLFAALIAERGFESNPARSRHKQGCSSLQRLRANYCPSGVRGWGSPWGFETAEMGLKHSACWLDASGIAI